MDIFSLYKQFLNLARDSIAKFRGLWYAEENEKGRFVPLGKDDRYMKKIILFCVTALLIFCLAGCTQSGTEPEKPAEPAESSAAEEGTDVSETETTAEPTPAPEVEGVVPTPAPEGEDSELQNGLLPMPEVGSAEFVKEFMENPIDAQYEADMNDAASMTAMVDACTKASESWKMQIDSVYMIILEDADAATVETVKAEQEEWLNQQNNNLQKIRDEVNEEDAMAAMTVAENIMLYYRSRAIDLCAILYEADGQLSFG